LLLKTYADAGYDNTWEALITMCNLFRRVAIPIAEVYGFDYPHGDDRRVRAHLEHVRFLPKNASEMY
jgi:aminoglycoside 6-adenylyltransferase